MSDKELSDRGENHKTIFSEVLPRSPLLASDREIWGDISLEQHHLPPGETPEYALKKFVITINLGQSFQVKRNLGSHRQTGLMFTGAVALCPMQTPQVIRWDRDVDILVLNLEPELLTRNAIELLDRDRFELLPHLIVQDTLIYQMGLALKNQLQMNRPTGRLYADSAATFLAVHLLQNYSTRELQAQMATVGLSYLKLKLVTDYINDSLEHELSLSELATKAQLSQYHFARAFKQSTGLSPHQYVIQQRIERAKQLLVQGKMTLSEVAIACGFSHQSHFNRHFKRLTGVTPKTLLKT
jgi:AraC family transcriptional regulator